MVIYGQAINCVYGSVPSKSDKPSAWKWYHTITDEEYVFTATESCWMRIHVIGDSGDGGFGDDGVGGDGGVGVGYYGGVVLEIGDNAA